MPRIPGLEAYALWRKCIHRQADSGLTIAQFGIVPNRPLEAGMSWTVKARCTRGDLWPQSPGGTSVKCAELSALQGQRSVKLEIVGLGRSPQFCTRECLSVTTFQNWKRRLRLIDLADRPSAAAPPAFLPVTVRVPEHAPREPFAIEADLPNGIRLRIPTTNVPLACRLVRLVARAKTNAGGSRC